MNTTPSPVRLTGHLAPELSRWKWLVKWILLIPHYIVLIFLWVAFVFATIGAWFAIVFTGRYPRGIFDFNLGVLRWTWRVTYYGHGVMGTDQYPPFSRDEEPDYPATLYIEYPEQLSRGLVWVKSWLLAIPHLAIVAVATSGIGAIGGGLASVLVLIAVLILAFTGSYPRGLHDPLMGMQRWYYRVVAYVALMTDTYPPFRLDMGEEEPS
jgi:hypothetical protein